MTYLFGNIIIFLLVAAGIGMLAGWLLGKSVANKTLQKRYQILLGDFDSVTSQLTGYRSKLTQQDTHIQRLTSRYTLKERDNRILARSFLNLQKKYKTLKTVLERLQDRQQAGLQVENSNTAGSQTARMTPTLPTAEEKNTQGNHSDTQHTSHHHNETDHHEIKSANADLKINRNTQAAETLPAKIPSRRQTHNPTVTQPARINLIRSCETIDRSSDKPSEPDDLTLIRGIGKVNEKILHEAGITTFAQIAAFGPADIERLGKKLGAFQNRITQEKWVEQAKVLCERNGKYSA